MSRLVLVIVLSLISFISSNLGVEWLTIGHGLHPIAAFSIAIGAFIATVIVVRLPMQVCETESGD
jgi:hypothetical protein